MTAPSITCPECGMTSYNPNDIREGYCGNCNAWTSGSGVDMSEELVGPHNIFRDNKVHVLAEKCATCIFNPKTRPVAGARVAEMVRDTLAEDGATVVCHSTLYEATGEPQENAICRGWYDRLADRDPILRLARAFDVIEEVPVPPTRYQKKG